MLYLFKSDENQLGECIIKTSTGGLIATPLDVATTKSLLGGGFVECTFGDFPKRPISIRFDNISRLEQIEYGTEVVFFDGHSIRIKGRELLDSN